MYSICLYVLGLCIFFLYDVNFNLCSLMFSVFQACMYKDSVAWLPDYVFFSVHDLWIFFNVYFYGVLCKDFLARLLFFIFFIILHIYLDNYVIPYTYIYVTMFFFFTIYVLLSTSEKVIQVNLASIFSRQSLCGSVLIYIYVVYMWLLYRYGCLLAVFCIFI